MSAPTVERTWPTTPRARVPAQRTNSAAIGRAYARRAGRQQRLADPTRDDAVGRPRFVLMVMALLGAGLVASLWLSTSAAADSYRLDQTTHATRDLSERSETLRTEIAAMRSAPALAQAARDLGMVPVSDVARLVARPDGSVVIVGTPKAGVAPAPVLPPLPDPGAPPSAVPGAVPGQAGAVPGQAQAAAAQVPQPAAQQAQQAQAAAAQGPQPAARQPQPAGSRDVPGQLAAGAGP